MKKELILQNPLVLKLIILYQKSFYNTKFIYLINANEISQYIINQHSKDFQQTMLDYIDNEKFHKTFNFYIFINKIKRFNAINSRKLSRWLVSQIHFYRIQYFCYIFILINQFFFEKHHKNYKEDVSFYIDCLTASIQSLAYHINDYESLSQRVFSNFLDFL